MSAFMDSTEQQTATVDFCWQMFRNQLGLYEKLRDRAAG
jgi:hypothetical protein